MSRYGDEPRHSPMTTDRKTSDGSREPTAMCPTSRHPSDPLHHGGDPMDVTSPPASSTMGPPMNNNTSPNGDTHTATHNFASSSTTESGVPNALATGPGVGAAAAAAAATQQPKLVQTAFIHKLYNMLEDPNIQHLISWSNTNESFVVSPSNEFSKVLAQYFKHTNISSFVRQLNMYGFHKVSDVFHTGAPESTLWEFKHGNGNFKRGDLVGLREIKRRASRHALINRDSFSSAPKANMSQPGTPAEPILDSTEARLQHLEHSLYDVHARLARTEEQNHLLSNRHQYLLDGLMRCHQWNHHLSHALTTMVSDPDSQAHRDVSMLQQEIGRQIDMLRAHEDPPENPFAGRQPHFSNLSLENAPLSPRQNPQDAHHPHRLNTLNAPPRPNLFRQPAPPPFLSVPPRKYGSVGSAHQSHAGSHRPSVVPTPPQHPLASVSPPNASVTRRHTSADIRLHGWQGQPTTQFGSGGSGHWPPSPRRAPMSVDSPQHVRDVLAQYEIRPSSGSRQTTPPLTSDTTPSTTSAESAWSFGGGGSKFGSKATDTSAAGTRRSSMASNVHSLLNPAETAETADEDDAMNDDRKRKRVQ